MNTESNYQRTIRALRESAERLRVEQDLDPQAKAMREALQPTSAETAELEAAQAAVAGAEQAVGVALLALDRAYRAKEPAPSGHGFFERSKGSYRAAAAAVSIPTLKVDVEEAHTILSSAIKRRNEVARRIEAARMDRRRLAKAKFAPVLEKPKSHHDRWHSSMHRRAA